MGPVTSTWHEMDQNPPSSFGKVVNLFGRIVPVPELYTDPRSKNPRMSLDHATNDVGPCPIVGMPESGRAACLRDSVDRRGQNASQLGCMCNQDVDSEVHAIRVAGTVRPKTNMCGQAVRPWGIRCNNARIVMGWWRWIHCDAGRACFLGRSGIARGWLVSWSRVLCVVNRTAVVGNVCRFQGGERHPSMMIAVWKSLTSLTGHADGPREAAE